MLVNEPLWYKDAIIYELHVRSFHDGIGDGMGDFAGLAKKIDYLQDLGVTAVWLLPFYPSPLRDDGYDIADYADIHPHYGKLKDFQEFLEAAHDRGIRVITELVINHTSDRHPWFQRARRAPVGSAERDFYVWSDTQDKYKEARIIFKDFENSNWTWDPVANAYYWHRFYSHQPDLNYDNPAVWNAIFPLVDFWLGMGVDGMRLDAVPYLYERDGTSCENLPETHVFLKALRKHIDERFPNRMLLAEANQWPEDSAAYFGDGDESNMAFHFPLMPRMFMAIHMEDRYPILDIMAQTPAIPENSQWCLFLRNHDELTLEMVTDEERDYMYRAYASESRARINLGIRRRLAPLLGNNRRKIELMNGLLFSLPGTPVLYYGDEIGMGDNIYLGDRNGVRTPMQWSADRNGGFSRANPQKLFLPVVIDPEYHYEALNVEAQQNNPNSLLWWMKRLIALRKRHKAFGRGTLEFLQPGNRKILAFLRRYENECILVVANLSRFVQHADLDLGGLQGLIPIELFGRNPFPRIGKQTYPLTLGPHAFYWFTLETPKDSRSNDLSPAEQKQLPLITSFGGWEELFRTPGKERLEEALAEYLQKRHWAGDAGRIKTSIVREAFHIRYGEVVAYVCRVEVEYFDGPARMILVPLTLAQGELQQQITANSPRAIVARLRGSDEGVLFDAVDHAEFGNAVLRAIAEGKRYSVGAGEFHAQAFTSFNVLDKDQRPFVPCVCSEEQTNTSIIFGESLVLKIFRSIEEGVHPEVEIGRYLTEKTKFTHCAPLLGVVEYVRRKSEPVTLAVLHAHVANEGTAWQYSLDELSRYFERVLSLPPEEQQMLLVPNKPVAASNAETPAVIREMIGRYFESVRILGKRTGEFHLALGAEKDDPAFTPEPFTGLYQRSVYQSMRNAHRRAMDRLHDALPGLDPSTQADAQRVLDRAGVFLSKFHSLLHGKFTAQRIRCHGDLNLCEVLYTGKDFAFIDFEGDTDRSLSDRRVKRAALRDVASMIRSFHYAAFSALHGDLNSRGRTPGMIRPEDISTLMPWAKTWYTWVSANYLSAYLETTEGALFLPHTREETEALLNAFLLEKSLTELHHELTHRPPWVGIPLQGLLHLLDDEN